MQRKHSYSVERDFARPGFVVVSLVRRELHHRARHHLHHRERDNPMVVFRRLFRATQLTAIDHYAAQLARITHHVENRTFGCFVDIDSRVGIVQIALYERWFDGDRLHCDELARDVFDSDDEETLAASAEYLAQLEVLAERRDREREAAYIDACAEDEARTEQAITEGSTAEELVHILAAKTRQAYAGRTARFR